MEARTVRFDLGIWLVAAAAAIVVGLALWQVRPASPLPAIQPRLAPTAEPLASPSAPLPNPATTPAVAPDGASPEAAATAHPIVTSLPAPDRPTVPAPGRAGAQNGPAVIKPGNPAFAEDPPAPQQATGEAAPPRKGDLGN